MTVSDVRPIEVDSGPVRYARGWHCLGLANTFRDGKPHALSAFGQKLVVWATSTGQLKVIDGFCRHMGGDLTLGSIKGDEVACPFHDWRWGGDGRCKAIPYARRVPVRARTASWPTLDQDGLLFVWNDPEGNPPPADVVIPRIEGADSDEWTDWLWFETKVEGAHCREVVDNVVDMAHFFYVHFSMPTFFKNVFEGHVATQLMRNVAREDTLPLGVSPSSMSVSSSAASYHGPSFMIDELTNHAPDGDLQSVLINCHYPVDEQSFVLQYGIIVKKPAADPAVSDAIAQSMIKFIKLGFEQDVAIWKSKARIDNPLLCEEDGPLYQLRRWYEQFYVDVADVRPEMVDRFEFEVDTTRPTEAWRAEIEANIAKRQSVAEQPV